MDKTTLKIVRLVAPGVIILVGLLPYLKLQDLKSVSDALPDGIFYVLLTFAAVVVGGVYYGLDIRGLLWKGFVRRCHDNVWAKMIQQHWQDPSIQSVIDHLDNKKAMRIFYNILDNDSSLKDQAHDVRLNGAVLSTIIDCIIIGVPFAISYILAFLLTKYHIFLWCVIIVLLLHLFLWLLKSRISEKHIKLENEQLAVIAQLHADKVRSQLQALK